MQYFVLVRFLYSYIYIYDTWSHRLICSEIAKINLPGSPMLFDKCDHDRYVLLYIPDICVNVCECVCECMCTCGVCVCVWMSGWVDTCVMCMSVCECMCTCGVFVCVCVNEWVDVYVWCVWVCVSACVCVMYEWVCECVNTHVLYIMTIYTLVW